VACLASGFHPAVLRLVREVIAAAHAQGRWVGLCGELAGEPLAIPILLGLGLDEFSMNAPAIPLAKEVVRALTLDEVRQVAQAALELDGPEAVQALVRERVPAAGE
jgi:phosphoenolpyruvate-protein kinase (PTS system EI component)